MKKTLAVLCALFLVFAMSAYGADKERGLYKDDGDFVDSQSVGMLTYGLYQSSPQTVTDGDVAPIQLDANGNVVTAPGSPVVTVAAEYTSQALTGAALDYTTSFGAKTKITTITLNASEAITETVTFAINSLTGANYDTVIVSEGLTAETDVYYSPENLVLRSGDELDIDCTNNNTTGSVFAVVVGETLS